MNSIKYVGLAAKRRRGRGTLVEILLDAHGLGHPPRSESIRRAPQLPTEGNYGPPAEPLAPIFFLTTK